MSKVSFIQFVVDLEPVSLTNDLQKMKGIRNVMQILKDFKLNLNVFKNSYNYIGSLVLISDNLYFVIIAVGDPLKTLFITL